MFVNVWFKYIPCKKLVFGIYILIFIRNLIVTTEFSHTGKLLDVIWLQVEATPHQS